MRVKVFQKEGCDIIGFGVGEFDFDMFDNIKVVVICVIWEGFIKYMFVGGIDEFKDVVIEKFKRDNGFVYKCFEIIVFMGVKYILFNMVQVFFGLGDEVIILVFYWVLYLDIVQLVDVMFVIVDIIEEEGFKLMLVMFGKALIVRMRAFIFNSFLNLMGVEGKEIWVGDQVRLDGQWVVCSRKWWVEIMQGREIWRDWWCIWVCLI